MSKNTKKIELTEEELKVFAFTKNYSCSDHWSHVLEIKKIIPVVKSIYNKNHYTCGAKSFLTKYFNKKIQVEKAKYSGQHFTEASSYLGNDKSPAEINNFLERTSYYAPQRSKVIYGKIFENHSDVITMKNKLDYLSRDMGYLKHMDFSDDSAIEMRGLLEKEIDKNYPLTNVFFGVLKDLTMSALELITDRNLEESTTSRGITNYRGFYESSFERFFYNSGGVKKTFMAKKIFEMKFKEVPFLLMTDEEYRDIMKMMIEGDINTNEKVALVSNVIDFKTITDEEILKLKANNYLCYPLSKKQVEVYGRHQYIIDILDVFLRAGQGKLSFTIEKQESNYLKNLLTFDELVKFLEAENKYGFVRLFIFAAVYPEGLFDDNGELDFNGVIDLYELNQAY